MVGNWDTEPCCEYEWNDDVPLGRYPVRFIRCNGYEQAEAATVERIIAELARHERWEAISIIERGDWKQP